MERIRYSPTMHLTVLLLGACLGQDPAATVMEAWPAPGTLLPAWAPVHVRIAYRSGTGLRFQASSDLSGPRTNPAPVHPAGEGEAWAWISFGPGQEVDGFRVDVLDASWKKIATISVSGRYRWTAGATPLPPPPDWIAERQQAAARLVEQQAGSGGSAATGGFAFLIEFLLVMIPAYLVLQIVALVRLKGKARMFAAIPLFVMVPVYVLTAFMFLMKSNLGPIWAILLSPPAFLYVLVVMLAARKP